MQAKVNREFYAIRYSHSTFGARPDLTHPDMVAHALSDSRYIVQECVTMTAAYVAAHAVIGSIITDGPLKGRSAVGGNVEVLRVAEHEPVEVDDGLGIFSSTDGKKTVTMTITGIDVIEGVPHFATAPLSRYNPVNGWTTPATVDAE